VFGPRRLAKAFFLDQITRPFFFVVEQRNIYWVGPKSQPRAHERQAASSTPSEKSELGQNQNKYNFSQFYFQGSTTITMTDDHPY
jgi:hypothetical protein